MKKNGILRNLLDAIRDPEREVVERVYLALSIISEVAVFLALIGDIVTGENPYEIALIVGTLVFVPVLMIVCLRREKLKLAIKVTVIAIVFVVLPGLYFFGGGVKGGGVLWIIFSFIYAGLVLTGTWRTVIMMLVVLMAMCCYTAEYYYPQLVFEHSREMFMTDSFISIILVGIVCFAMTWLQNYFFMGENKRARDAADKAEELTRAQNRFFSSMSHEIRTPINSILGLNELILRDQSASQEVVKDARGIQGSGKMLLALINDILDFSKMEAGSMDIIPVEYRIGEVLSEIVNMIWLKATDKGLKLNVTIDPKVPTVLYGDEVRVKQIIINLLNNAVKYTAEGSVELHLESNAKNDKTVELSISVTDTGMGIKKEVIPYLFDVFKRVDQDKNRYIEGTGLGLSIVKQLVELMGGTITVNSVYGEGSTFTVVLAQGIADHTEIGDFSIHNQSFENRSAYESSFRAPDARILIVDDNEMNLEVEAKLLNETQMTIDKASSGAEALELDLKYHYDVIFMDHLMPEMDGIECLEKIRNHSGGMNRTTPVLVLTANAGSDNREIYNRSGFDGYLVKPVTGEALENTLMKFIPEEKLIVNTSKVMSMREDINTAAGYSGKAQIVITSTSMCDLPDALIKKLHIPLLPFVVQTEEGIFKDGVQISADELIRYISSGKNAASAPPDETTYRDFFAKELKKAHHLIHIALTSGMSTDYKMALEAAKSFDNVTIVNSECVSSSTGLLVLIAYKLAQLTDSVEEIVAELDAVKKRLKCSFIIDNTAFIARSGRVSPMVDRFARSLNLHPCLQIKDDRSGIGGVWTGSRKRAYRKYISKAFPVDVIPDAEVLFITYADVPIETLRWIQEEVSKIAYFENVVFMQASAAISSNCGPGSFGLMYFVKSNKSYNLSSLFDEEGLLIDDEDEEESFGADSSFDEEEESVETAKEVPVGEEENGSEDELRREDAKESSKWYETIPGIRPEVAIKNSGSEDAFRTVLQIFYETIKGKADELEKYLSEGDFKNYTIKVHALKSSCKLIGAVDTSDKAQLLENAGKEENYDYIKENHTSFIEEYLSFKDALSPIFEKDSKKEAEDTRPVADEFLMESVYEGLRDAAEAMDCDAVDAVFDEIKDYAVPDSEKEKFDAVRERADQFDYQGMLEILNGNDNQDK